MTTPTSPGPRPPLRKLPFVLGGLALLFVSLLVLMALLPLYSRGLSRLFVLEGASDYAAGKDRPAVQILTQAIALDPKAADAYSARGSAYDRLGAYVLALADFEQAVKLAPTSASAYYNRGEAYGQLGQFDAALADETGGAHVVPGAISIYEVDGGIAWKHGDNTRRARDLVVSFLTEAGNYEYGFDWIFHQDGTLESRVELTGTTFATICA